MHTCAGMFVSGNVSINELSVHSAEDDLVQCSVASDPVLPGRGKKGSHLSEGELSEAQQCCCQLRL